MWDSDGNINMFTIPADEIFVRTCKKKKFYESISSKILQKLYRNIFVIMCTFYTEVLDDKLNVINSFFVHFYYYTSFI